MRSSKKRRTVRAVLAAILSVAMAVSGVPTNALAEAAREVSGQSDGWEMPDEQVTSEQLRERENESVPEEEPTGSSEQPQEQTEQDVPEPSGEDPPAGDEQVPEPADEQVPEEEAPDGTYVPEEEAPVEGENPAEERNTEDTLTFEDNSIKVTATLADASALPAGTELVVTPVTPTTDGYDYDAFMGALNDSVKKENPYNEKNTLLYDVSFVAADEEGKAIEVEPAEGTVTVNFEFKQQQLSDDLGAKKADDVTVTHLPESDGKIEVEKIADATGTGEEQIEITTDSFSVYAFSYTVDFTYDDFTYSIAGETNILLSKLFEILGIEEDVADVKDVSFTNTDFVKVEKKGDDWLLTSLKPFTSDETLTVELFNGAKYVIAVTDAVQLTYSIDYADLEGNPISGMPDDVRSKNPHIFVYLEDADGKIVGWRCKPFDYATSTVTIASNEFSNQPYASAQNVTYDPNIHTAKARVVSGDCNGGDILGYDWNTHSFDGSVSWNGKDQFEGYKFIFDQSNPYHFTMQKDWKKSLTVDLSYAGSDTGQSAPGTIIIRGKGSTTGWHYYKVPVSNISWNESATTYDIPEWYKKDGQSFGPNDYSDAWQSVEAILFAGDVSIQQAAQQLEEQGQNGIPISAVKGVPYLAGYSIHSGERIEGAIDHEAGTQTMILPVVFDSTPLDDALTPEDVLGDAHEFGIVADTYDQSDHTETNFAVHHLRFSPEGQNLDIDGSGDKPIPFYIGELHNKFRFGGRQNVDAYVFMTQNDIENFGVSQDSNNYIVSVQDLPKQEIDDYVDSMLNDVAATSQYLLTKTTIKPDAVNNGKIKVNTMDYPDNATIYVDCSNIMNKIANNGDLLIEKLSGQTIVFNIPTSGDVTIGEFGVKTEKPLPTTDGTANGYVQSTTAALNGNPVRNQMVDDVILSHIIFNAANASSVSTINASAVFLAPNATNFTQENGAGWIVTGGTVKSGKEWHFYRHNRHYDNAVGQLRISKLLNEDAPSSAKENEYSFYVRKKVDGQDIYYYNETTVLDDGSTVSTNTSYEQKPITVTGTGKVTLTKLPPDTYELVEVRDGITIANYTLEVTGEGSKKVAGGRTTYANITNTYTPQETPDETGSLRITKSVTGATLTAEDKAGITFNVVGPDNYSASKKYSEFTGDSWTIEDLTPGQYTVTETAGTKEGYNLTTTYSVDNGRATVAAGQIAEVTVTNAYEEQTVEKTQVTGTKTWLDGGKSHDNANEVTLTLKRTSSKYTTPQAVTATPAWNGDTYTFANLDKNDDEGNPYTYEVTEGAINGYTSTKVEGTNNFVNKSDEKVSVSVEKIWNDSNNQDQKRPTSVKVRLHAGSEQVGSEITLSESDQWKHTWSNLYKYDQTTGAAIVYTVTEDEVSNYSTQITQKDNSEYSYVVTNSYTPGQTSVTVEKEWIDGDNAKSTRPTSVSVQLLADGEASGGPVTLDASKNWEYTWTGLPEKKDGETIAYTVSEQQVNGYAAPEITGSAKQGFVIKNKLSGTVEVSGTKTWLDGGKTHDNAKEITLTLKRKSAKPDSVEESVEASATWTNNTYTFGSQPKYDDYGYEYTYTVSEGEIEGYSTTHNGYNITNTIESAGVTITKQWNDFANEDHSRPTADSFKAKLNLFAKVGEGQSTEVTDTYANDLTVTNNSNGTYTATWANLPQVDENGQSIVYTVTEDSITGYTSSTNDPVSDGGTLVNTHMPTVDIQGHKVWDDEESAKETTRKPIAVQLQSRNGDGAEWANVEGKTAVPSGENLSFAFEALPKYYGDTTDTLIQYQVVETQVPDGYTATDGNASNGYTIINSLKKGERVLPVELTIHKTDDKNVNLPGAVYEVTATGETQTGSECGEYTTDSDGKAFVTFTTPGTWKLEEKTAPAGYLLNDAEYVIVVNQSGDVEVKLEEDDVWTWIYHLIFGSPQLAEGNVLNVTDAPTRVFVSKTDIANGEEVVGATIQIIDSKGEVVEQWVSGQVEGEEGPHLIEGLKIGEEYTLRETVAPEGYTIATDTTFNIDETGKVTSSGSVTEGGVLLVEDAKTKVKVSKVDIANGEEVDGATIQIIDSKGEVVEQWVSGRVEGEEGPHLIEGLKTGVEYTLRETVAPEGYTIATDTTFTIDETGKVITTGTKTTDEEGNTVLIVEDAKTKVTVSKTDIASGEELEGAQIQIIDSEGKVVEKWTSTDEPHVIEGLKTGVEYTLRETVAPDGYAIATDTTFTIDERGKVTTTGSVTEGGVLLVEDALTRVSISKVDVDGGAEIPGAKIQILNQDDEVAKDIHGNKAEWTSTTQPHVVEGLKAGTYTLHEVIAPNGYTIATDTTFTIDKYGKVTTESTHTTDGDGNTILLVQDARTEVKVSKVDIANDVELPGATIVITDSEGTIADSWVSGVDDPETEENEAIHVIRGLKTGELYTMTETVAPDGYKIATAITFTIDTDGKVTVTGAQKKDGVILIKDAPTTFTVSKTAIAGSEELAGAKLEILVKDENDDYKVAKTTAGEELSWTSGDTAKTITGLKTGVEYTLRETVAPAGYTIATKITFTLDQDGNVIVKGKAVEGNALLIQDALTAVKVAKTDIANGEELEGATIQVLDGKGEVVTTATGERLEWTSTTEPKLIEGLTTGTEYTLRETVAPEGYDVTTDIKFTIDEAGKVTTTGKSTTDAEGKTVILVEDAKPAIEKYVNKDVHSDLDAFDSTFTYDILAFVTGDADKVEIYDELIGNINFTQGVEVKVADMGTTNDHKANGTVDTDGDPVEANAAIEGKNLKVTINDAKSLRNHWVKVTFTAKLNNAEGAVSTWAEYEVAKKAINNNGTVISEIAKHRGIDNKASYKVLVQTEGANTPDDTTDDVFEDRHERESNVVTVTPKTTTVQVQKKWTNNKGKELSWPAGAEVAVELLCDGAPTNNIKTLTASETSATFANLPVYEGKQYGVAEASVVGVPAGFITTVAGSAADGFVITNSEAGPEVEKYVNKDVHADLNAFDTTFNYDILAYVTADATSVTITDELVAGVEFANGADTRVTVVDLGEENDHTAFGTVSKNGSNVEATPTINGNKLEVEIPDARSYRNHWVKVSYMAKLNNGAVGNWSQYETAAQQIPGNGTVVSTAFANGHKGVPNTARYAVYTVKSGEGEGRKPTYEDETNTVTVTPKTTEVSVDKKWLNAEREDMAWPAGASIEVELLQGKDVYDMKTLVSATPVTFTDLPVYESAAKQYSVREKVVPEGYTAEVTGTAAAGYTITNTMKSQDVKITKAWDDFSNEDNKRPSAKDFAQYLHLWANDVDVTSTYASKLTVADKGNTYEAQWTGLPAMDGMTPVVYQVSEDKVPGYAAVTQGRVDANGTITNKHVVKTTVSGQKQWADDASKATSTRPESITVNLLQNDAKIDSASVKPNDNGEWLFSFEDLDKYDENGEPYTYTVTEDEVKGYTPTVASDATRGFVITNEIVDHRDDEAPVELTVRKKDAEDESLKLTGAEFTLTRTDKENVTPVVATTGEDGTATFTFAESGTWSLKETKAPAGYTLSDKTIQIEVKKGEIESVTYDEGSAVWSWLYNLVFGKPEVTDNVLEVEDGKTAVNVSKTDIAGGPEVAGAHIQILDADQHVVTEWDSEEGKTHEVKGLTTGVTYTLRETVAPAGYTIATNTIFQLNADGTVATLQEENAAAVKDAHTVLVEDAKTVVKVSKVDIANGEEVAGATIQIIDSKGEVVEQWTSAADNESTEDVDEGIHTIKGLKAGEQYTLRETVAPEGYTIATDTKFTIDETGKVTSSGTITEGGVLLVEDTKTVVKVSKTDIASGEELEGAQIQIIDSKGKVVEKWTSAKDNESTDNVDESVHVIEGLKTGEEYTLRETVAPDGYAIATDTTFTIDENGKVTTTGSVTEDGVLLVEDALTKVSVSKVAVGGGEELAGAKIQLMHENAEGELEVVQVGDADVEWISEKGKAHDIIGLKPGDYVLRETVAPAGYAIATDIAFTLNADGTVTTKAKTSSSGAILIEDALTTVSIKKTDIADGFELPGAKMKVVYAGDNGEEEVFDQWVSGEEAHEVKGLVAGVVYTLREVVAPTGYAIATETTFALNADGTIDASKTSTKVQDGELLVEDAKTKITVSKTDITGEEELKGAHIQILNAAGEVVVLDGDKLEWDSDGSARTIEGLRTGIKYTLRETVAPEGYTIAADTKFTIDETGKVKVGDTVVEGNHILIKDAKNKVTVSKTDATGEEELEGATLKVVDSKGKKVDEWTTTKDEQTGKVEKHVIEGLKVGETYTLVETVAPDGYTVATATTFTVDEHGDVTTTGTVTEDEDGNPVLLVKDDMTKVKVSKTDIANGEEIEGATIQIMQKKAESDDLELVTLKGELLEWVSEKGKSHVIEGLKTGVEYTLRETVAPDGYTIATDTTFTIDETGKVTTTGTITEDGVLLVQDAMTEVAISKHDVTNDKELAGAKIQIKDGDEVVREWTSTEEPTIIKGLKTGVTYTLHEETAPKGYKLSADTTFTIATDGTVETQGSTTTDAGGKTVLLVEDAMTSVKVSKTDIVSGEELKGATIEIVYTDDEGEEQTFTSWTSTKKPHEVIGLLVGVEYILRETVAPEGHTIAADTTFTIDENGKVKVGDTVVEDNHILIKDAKTKVKVSKTDIADGEEVEGATIQIIETVKKADGTTEEKVVEQWTSTNEPHLIEGLKTGVEYTLRETVAPDGYAVATDTTFTIDETGKVTTTGSISEGGVLLVEDAKTKVSISKTDITGEEELKGAHIQIIDSEGKVVELDGEKLEWDSDGSAHVVEGLKTGVEYTLRETVAPEGHTIAADTTFTIDENGKAKVGDTVVEDNHVLIKDAKTKVKVSKTDIANGEEVDGATIQIIDSKGEVVEQWVSGKVEGEEGPHLIEGLKTGEEYTLRETVAPEGYAVATDTTFTIDERGKVTTTGTKTTDEEGNTVLLVEDAKTVVKVSKTDIASGEELEGAQIQIIDSKGKVVEKWTSAKDDESTDDVDESVHVIEGLKTGVEYTLRETVAPDGYTIATDTTFTIDETGKVTTTGTITEEGVLLVEDAMTKVNVSKTDIANGEELEGAEVKVIEIRTSADGTKIEKIVHEWTSVKDDEETADVNEAIYTIEGLKTGTQYVLRETVAPDGYTVATDIEFTISTDGKVTTGATTAKDKNGNDVILIEDAKTVVKVSKTDIASGEELEGAHIQVLKKATEDGEEDDLVKEWVSGTKPEQIEGLVAGVTYVLRETVAPDGYTVTTDIEFSLDKDGKVQTGAKTTTGKDGTDVILVEDAKTKVKVSKTDIANGEEVDGATIQIIDSEGKVVEQWTSGQVEGEEGPHLIEGLKTGVEYTLRETVAPDGYTVATDTTFTIDENGKVTTTGTKTTDEEGNTVLLVEDAKTKVTVSKTDIANGEELPGATIQVLAQNKKTGKLEVVKVGGEKVEWVSTDEPHVIEGLKTGVEYTLRETVAPDGYAVATDITFTIAEDGTVSVTGTAGGQAEDGTILVEDALTRVTISKADVDGGAEVPGATIQILDEDGNVVKINGKKVEWVSTDEPHEVVGLKTGVEYTLHETVAPDGYAFSTDTTFTINADGTVEVISAKSKDKDGKTVLVVEDAMTEVRVSKVETGAGEELAGAHIQILDEDGNIITEWDSLADDEATEDVNEGVHVVKGLLNTGVTYTLRETVAPDGYTLTSDTTFSIAEDGKVKANGTKTTDDEGNTVLLVEDAKTKVTVSKTDIANGEELPGATIQIIDSEGEVVEEWVSTDKPHDIEGLKTGVEYTLRETVAPDGYAIATDTTFTIDENGKVTSSGSITEGGVLLVEDAKTSVKVSKRDATSGAELPGAHMQILDSAGNVVEKWVSTTETRVFEGLKTGETYTLRETVAPEGYAVTTNTTFQIAADGTVTTNDTVAKDGIILVEDYKLGEIVDKYVNGKPHMDANLGEEFEYEILAFVTSDAVYGEIEDVLDKRLVFASTDPSSVTVEDIGTVKDVTAKGTALDASNVEVRIDGQTLIVGLSNLQDEAVGLTNHWVRVAFRAKLAEGVNAAADIDNVANYKIANFIPGLEWEPSYGSTTPFASVTPVVSVEKVWQNAEGEDVDWPEGATVTVELLSDGEPLDPAYTEVLSADQTSATFTGMEAGHEYTVRETEVSGATVTESVVAGSALEGFTITNKLPAEEPVNSREIGVSKVWQDADGNEMDWPEGASVTIELFCDGESLDPAQVVELTADKAESTFEVENFDESAEYTVRETRITDGGGIYKYQKTGDVEEGFVVTNRFESAEPDGDTVEVEVAKEWLRDGDSIDWPEGAEVTVELLKDGKSLDPAVTLVLTEDEDTGTFSELPAGAKYTVKEIKVSGAPTGFKKSIEGSAEEGFTITNEYPATEEESVKPEDSKKSEDSTKASENTNASTTTTGTKSIPYTSTVGSGTSGSSTTRTSTPRTGDPTSVVAAITLMAGGLATLGYGVRRRRRK